MLRKLLKSGVAWGLHRSGIGRRNSRLIVGYHRTVAEFPRDPRATLPPLCISVKMLERQLDWIGRRFQFVSLDEWSGPDRRSRKIAAVTFDDGYQDFYTHAFPLLQRKGIPAAVFVSTDLVDTSELHIHDRLYLLLAQSRPPVEAQQLLEPLMATLPQSALLGLIAALETRITLSDHVRQEHRSLTWHQIERLHKAGITIGSHTRTHAILPNEEIDTVWSELRGSREILENRLETPIHHFAYPCGQFSARTVKAVERAGYGFAYTICNHRDRRLPHLTIPRKVLWENSCLDALGSFSPSLLSCHVHGSFEAFKGCELNHGGALCWS
jgi:peptidoglycan/xylan/chitin deacetylase (PgdA/CDA1 family)